MKILAIVAPFILFTVFKSYMYTYKYCLMRLGLNRLLSTLFTLLQVYHFYLLTLFSVLPFLLVFHFYNLWDSLSCMALSFSIISGAAYPAWLSAFQSSLGQSSVSPSIISRTASPAWV